MAGWHPNTLILKPGTGTFELQKLLPRLPLPDLASTLEAYIETVRPLVTEEELKKTTAVVEEFGKPGGIGEQLHAKLQEQKDKTDGHTYDSNEYLSWLEEMWDSLAYFRDRNPLPCNVNVFGTLFSFVEDPDPISLAAKMIHGCLMVKNMIEDKTLEPDALGRRGQLPLCMFQFRRIFGTTRIPHEMEDELVVYEGSRHVCVSVDGAFYTFDAVREDGSIMNAADIRLQLHRIWKMANRDKAEIEAKDPGMGTMTYEGRDEWAEARDHLLTNPTNARSLKTIERSLFVMCLDRREPKNPDEGMYLASVMGGKELWNDKSFNLIVFANGKAAFNGEHSASDAPVPSRMLWEASKYVVDVEITGKAEDQPMPKLLIWDTDSKVEEALTAARKTAATLMANHKVKTVHFKGFGRKFITQRKTAPDSFMQIALQLAFYRDQGTFTATYESATTRTFLHGRTECIRSCSEASVAFCKAMDDESVPQAEKLELFRTACQAHLFYLQKCMRGDGIDRVLLGMRVMAYFAGLEPEIFSDAGYVKSTKWDLSTSQMNYKNPDFPGFGAPFPESYGTCYVCALPDQLLANCSSNATCEGKDAVRFAGVLHKSIADLGVLLASGDSKL